MYIKYLMTVLISLSIFSTAIADPQYISYTAHAFRPQINTQQYASYPWRLYATNNVPEGNWFGLSIYLPDNAVVTEITVWVYDNDQSGDIQFVCSRTPLQEMNNVQEYLTSMNTSGSSGSVQELTDSSIDYAIIDNVNYKYYLGIFLPVPNNTHSLVGARIKYNPPTAIEEYESGNMHTYPKVMSVPNPTTSKSKITYQVKKTSPVKVMVSNTVGEIVRTLFNATQATGKYSLFWDGLDDNGKQLSAGEYIYVIQTNEECLKGKVMLLR